MASPQAGPPRIDRALKVRGRLKQVPEPALSPAPGWSVRDLPVAEWGKLAQVPLGISPDPSIYRAIVCEENGQIIACWFAYQATHVEPVWIHPDHRKRPGVIRRLWSTVVQLLKDCNVDIAFCTVADEVAMTSLPLVLRLGFKKVPGDCFYLDPNAVNLVNSKEPYNG